MSRTSTVLFAVPVGLLAYFLPDGAIYWGPILFVLHYLWREVMLIAADADRNLASYPNPLKAAALRVLGGAIYIGLFAIVGSIVGKSFDESSFIVAFTVTAVGLTAVQNLRYGLVRIVSDKPPPSAYYGRTTYGVSPVEEYEEVEYFRIRFRRRRKK